ncbi:hypothetical protein ACGFIR_12765 [Micromonospora sp. NPDC049051]|uniref:hypothetical protein n=1 Tax=Micromonospora sp. NPDC049051 TaxID=3364264 RepID=UPI003717D89C
MNPQRWARVVLLPVLLGVVGCGSAPGHTTAPVELPRPLDGVTYFTSAENSALHDAHEQLVTRCMRDRGFAYQQVPLSPATRLRDLNPYGLLSRHQARTDGYRITSSLAEEAKAATRPAPGSTSSPAWNAALLGTDSHRVTVQLPEDHEMFYNSDGCTHQATATLYSADWQRLYDTFQVLANRVVETVNQDAEFVHAQSAWSACMTRAGQPSRTFDEARGRIDAAFKRAAEDRADLMPVVRQELATATADAACQDETGMVEVVRAAQGRAEATVLDTPRQEQLGELRRLRADALRRVTTPPGATPR